MKKLFTVIVLLAILAGILSLPLIAETEPHCFTGAFLSDKPTGYDIANFNDKYGKKPLLVMIFVDWDNFVDEKIIRDVYSFGCILFVTWEPWHANLKEGIDFDGLLRGEYDPYIEDFASKIKAVNKPVFIRFGHEMNGNWYPWSGTKIGKDKFVAMYRYVKDTFDEGGATNIKWVFSVNWEDIPKENNHFISYYPGDEYVDYIGIDGYNWGNTRSWSRWMSFEDIFATRYREIVSKIDKPLMLTEFSSTSSGGNKARWIEEAMNAIKKMQNIKAFVLFNVDKETDWSFSVDSATGKEFKKQLKDRYFKDKYQNFTLK